MSYPLLLQKINRAVCRILNNALLEYEITGNQYFILGALVIKKNGYFSLQELAANLQCDRTTLTRNLKLLKKKGLISITDNEHDKRFYDIKLTTKGNKKVEQALAVVEEVNSVIAHQMPETGWKTLEKFFDAVREIVMYRRVRNDGKSDV